MKVPTETELRKPIVRADFERVPSLQQQLVYCKLKGLTTKASLLKATLNAIKITTEVEQQQRERRGQHVYT